jgi:transposase InsO family protein
MISPSCCPLRPHEPKRPDPPPRSRPPNSYTTSGDTTTPRTNGKAERFIQTCLREWLYAKPYPSSAHRTCDMPAWLHWYNHHRPHAGIHASTPVSRLNNLLGNDI